MQRLKDRGALSDSSCDPLHRTTANVANGKDALPARLQKSRRTIWRARLKCIGAGEHEAVLVQRNTIAEPACTGLRTEKQEDVPDRLLFDLPLPVPFDRFKPLIAVQFYDLSPLMNGNVGRRIDPSDQIIRHARSESVTANHDVDMPRKSREENRCLTG